MRRRLLPGKTQRRRVACGKLSAFAGVCISGTKSTMSALYALCAVCGSYARAEPNVGR